MDPFHVVHLAGDALDECRRRTGQELHHRRRQATDPCSPAITTSPSKSPGASTRTSPGAYRASDTSMGKAMTEAEINAPTSMRVPRDLTELITLGRTLKRRAGDILAYFDHPHTTGGPTEAINGCLEHLRGSALGFRNLTNYITRALLETGGFKPQLHPQL